MAGIETDKDSIYTKMAAFIIFMGDLFPHIPKWNMWIHDVDRFAVRQRERLIER